MTVKIDNEYEPLKWLKPEVDVTLDHATQALNHSLDHSFDGDSIQACLHYLGQVRGAFTLLALYGAKLDTEKLERVLRHVTDNKVRNIDAAIQCVLEGIHYLKYYLKTVKTSAKNAATSIMSELDELRALQSQQLLLKNTFTLDLEKSLPSTLQLKRVLTEAELNELVRSLRTEYQLGLMNWLGGNDRKSLRRMYRALCKIKRNTNKTRRLWLIVEGVFEAVFHDDLGVTDSLNKLFGQIDQQIKRLCDIGEAGMVAQPANDLMTDLLIIIAQLNSTTRRVSALKGFYQLEQMVADGRGILQMMDDVPKEYFSTINAVFDFSQQSLIVLKNTVNQWEGRAAASETYFDASLHRLKWVIDAFGILGLNELKAQVKIIRHRLLGLVEQTGFDPNAIETINIVVSDALKNLQRICKNYQTTVQNNNENDDYQFVSSVQLGSVTLSEYNSIWEHALDEILAEINLVKQYLLEIPVDANNQTIRLRLSSSLKAVINLCQFFEFPSQEISIIHDFVCRILFENNQLVEQTYKQHIDDIAEIITAFERYITCRKWHENSGDSLEAAKQAAAKISEIVSLHTNIDDDKQREQKQNYIAAEQAVVSAVIAEINRAKEILQRYLDDKLNDNILVDMPTHLQRARGALVMIGKQEGVVYLSLAEQYISRDLIQPHHPFSQTGPSEVGLAAIMDVVVAYTNYLASFAESNAVNVSLQQTSIDYLQRFNKSPSSEFQANDVNDAKLLLPDQPIADINDISQDRIAQADKLVQAAREAGMHEISVNFQQIIPVVREWESAPVTDEQCVAVCHNLAEIRCALVMMHRHEEAEIIASLEQYISASYSEPKRALTDQERQAILRIMNDFNAHFLDEQVVCKSDVLHQLVSGELRNVAPVSDSGVNIDDDDDEDIVSIFLEEADELIVLLNEYYPQWCVDRNNIDALTQIRRAFHTLKGSGRVAGLNRLGELAWSVEKVLNHVMDGTLIVSSSVVKNVGQVLDLLPDLVKQCRELGHDNTPSSLVDLLTTQSQKLIDNAEPEAAVFKQEPAESVSQQKPENPLPESTPELIQEPTPESAQNQHNDDILIDIFTAEATNHIAVIRDFITRARQEAPFKVPMNVVRAWHTLNGSAGMADYIEISELAAAAEAFVQWAYEGEISLDPSQLAVLEAAVVAINNSLGLLGQSVSLLDNRAILIEQLQALRPDTNQESSHATRLVDKEAATDTSHTELLSNEPQAKHDNIDLDETLEIFLDECASILVQLDDLLKAWQLDPNNEQFIREFERQVHTLKGGARLSQLVEMGDLSHSVETLLTEIAAKKVAVTEVSLDILQIALDQLEEMRERALLSQPLISAAALIAEIENMAHAESEPVGAANSYQQSAIAIVEKEHLPTTVADQHSIDQVRISTDVLDEMSNDVAEVSVAQARLSQQMGLYQGNLDDMHEIVNRLRIQLRRMEIETEAQIQFRHEEASSQGQEFDPLEFDRFTSMQQISRSLLETASDLDSIHDNFDKLTVASDTLLIQQSRTSAEIQTTLKKSRLIPFAKISPRLSRLVRQTANELGKKITIDIIGEAVEIDRYVLEQVVGPLEHIIRNAVDHGIELTEVRECSNKSEKGRIEINFERINNDVTIRINDDGRGLNLEAIRSKAIEKKLMFVDSNLKDEEILQFVFEPGFSTATTVTQISGRGLGLDIVANAVKLLGGALHIDSIYGQGTDFTIRLPVDMRNSRALFLQSKKDLYAVPLANVVDVARVRQDEFVIENNKPYYVYDGEKYEIKFLQSMLHGGTGLQDMREMIPVVFVNSGGYRVGLIVDVFKGSRDIMIKPVGVQLRTVRGVMGATIMGDGEVVLVLDVASLVRVNIVATQADYQKTMSMQTHQQSSQLNVMVIDDSVTMRRVTTKLLKRHEMSVVTANDGLDALGKLDDLIPDIILLDVEMPRMDGYELASIIRNSERLKHIPIIMITSRIGDKHRRRAEQIGVNDYIGKPYLDDDLLARIYDLTSQCRVNLVNENEGINTPHQAA